MRHANKVNLLANILDRIFHNLTIFIFHIKVFLPLYCSRSISWSPKSRQNSVYSVYNSFTSYWNMSQQKTFILIFNLVKFLRFVFFSTLFSFTLQLFTYANNMWEFQFSNSHNSFWRSRGKISNFSLRIQTILSTFWGILLVLFIYLKTINLLNNTDNLFVLSYLHFSSIITLVTKFTANNLVHRQRQNVCLNGVTDQL